METAEIRYYDKTLQCEVQEPNENTLTNQDIPWWFEELPEGKMVEYEADGTPVLVDEPVFTPDPNEERKVKLREEMNALMGDMTMPEAMFLMLQYGTAKMQGGEQSDDAGQEPITPTGEDLITWGDRIINELSNKIAELRSLK